MFDLLQQDKLNCRKSTLQPVTNAKELKMIVYDEELLVPNRNESATKADRKPILSNHTGYSSKGSESWEHDDTGSQQNYSGCYDDMMDPIAEHEGWQEGYDY